MSVRVKDVANNKELKRRPGLYPDPFDKLSKSTIDHKSSFKKFELLPVGTITIPQCRPGPESFDPGYQYWRIRKKDTLLPDYEYLKKRHKILFKKLVKMNIKY